MQRKHLGDSYDLVKRFWADNLVSFGQLLAHPRFVPNEIRSEYKTLTGVSVRGRPIRVVGRARLRARQPFPIRAWNDYLLARVRRGSRRGNASTRFHLGRSCQVFWRLFWIRSIKQTEIEALPPPPVPRQWVAGTTHRYL
jgi:hypothetical protein